MSRAFVKETDSVPELPDRTISPHPNLVTARGLALLDAAVEQHRAALAEAQAAGDRERIAAEARELRYFVVRRATADLQPPPLDTAAVRFGSHVAIEREDGRPQPFTIGGEDEPHPAAGLLSYAAPLARALLGKAVGDVVSAGVSEAEIVKIGRRH
jgi:transcription elongation GreA/GreB family factor